MLYNFIKKMGDDTDSSDSDGGVVAGDGGATRYVIQVISKCLPTSFPLKMRLSEFLAVRVKETMR